MPFTPADAPQRAPRRARYLIPPGTPRRREILAALSLLVVVAGLLFAQVTLGLTIAFHAISKISRWSPAWLAAPAACGLVWVLAIGPAEALAGFSAAPRVAMATLAGVITDPVRVFHLGGVPDGTGRWLPGQFPVALILAAGLAAAWWWLDWLHTDEWDLAVPRPGLVSACRRRLTAAFVRSGGVLIRGGASLGIDQASGRPAAVPWREAEQGVLVTGSAWAAGAASSFPLVHAAIRVRKPGIVVGLAGGAGLGASVAAAAGSANGSAATADCRRSRPARAVNSRNRLAAGCRPRPTIDATCGGALGARAVATEPGGPADRVRPGSLPAPRLEPRDQQRPAQDVHVFVRLLPGRRDRPGAA